MVKYRTVPRNCDACGNQYEARCFALAKGHGRFCSAACFGKTVPARARICRIARNMARLRGPVPTKQGDIVFVPLASTQGMGYAIIDAADAAIVGQYAWRRTIWGYAVTTERSNGVGRCLSMHRLLCQTPSDVDVDHINRVRLDNRRSNLRPAPGSLNSLNSFASRGRVAVRGVWIDDKDRYVVHLRRNGRTVLFRKFDTLQEAESVANAARAELAELPGLLHRPQVGLAG